MKNSVRKIPNFKAERSGGPLSVWELRFGGFKWSWEA